MRLNVSGIHFHGFEILHSPQEKGKDYFRNVISCIAVTTVGEEEDIKILLRQDGCAESGSPEVCSKSCRTVTAGSKPFASLRHVWQNAAGFLQCAHGQQVALRNAPAGAVS